MELIEALLCASVTIPCSDVSSRLNMPHHAEKACEHLIGYKLAVVKVVKQAATC